jgi:2,3-dihydroxy-p-cumate/2,3-dihydroxybenzoate 3,4-dioxygenase
VELNVSDPDRARTFYEELVGLEFAGTGKQGELRFRCSEDPYAVVLHPGKTPGFKRVGWMLEDASQLENLAAKLKAADVAYEMLDAGECRERMLGKALRMVEPYTRATFEFYVLPDDWAPKSWTPTLAKIQRLGHIALWTPHREKSCRFLNEVLNFQFSDSIGGAVSFLRCFPSPYHHGIGIAQSDGYGMHHLNFMVSEIDDVGSGFHRFNANGVQIMKGIGRHPASGSVFLYFLDPDALTLEYSFGMEQFPEFDPREARVLPLAPESIDIWLGPVDVRYAKTGEVEPYEVGA